MLVPFYSNSISCQIMVFEGDRKLFDIKGVNISLEDTSMVVKIWRSCLSMKLTAHSNLM